MALLPCLRMSKAQTCLCSLINTFLFITKICLYNADPLKPHFYIVKLGFTGVYIIFLLLLKNIDCGYSLEPPRCLGKAVLTSTHNLCFEQKYKKYQNFYLKTFRFFFFVLKFSIHLNRHGFVMSLLFSSAPIASISGQRKP